MISGLINRLKIPFSFAECGFDSRPGHPVNTAISVARGLLERFQHPPKSCQDCVRKCHEGAEIGAEIGADDEPDLDICPGCGGVADNGFDRCVPPNPYYCTKCMEAESEIEPPHHHSAEVSMTLYIDRPPVNVAGVLGSTVTPRRCFGKLVTIIDKSITTREVEIIEMEVRYVRKTGEG